ncbi:GIP [Symbiodinium sp. CCMP2592]|nr:GIP [Symbiodinium sp. CCMP2592]
MPSPGDGSGHAEGEDSGPPYRDREPPPYFDGEDPGHSFKPWLRQLELWAFDTEARGYVMFRQARLSTVQEDQLTTWTEGKFSREAVIKAMRKLDKVREQGSPTKRAAYFDEAEAEEQEEESDHDEEYIYMEQSDLQEVYEEAEVKQALATYQQVRRALQEQKNARDYYPTEKPKGKGKGTGKKGDRRAGTRIHISMLKLRTKCAKCGQIGHWAAECTNQPDGYRKPGGPATTASSSQVGGTSSKAGFYQASGDDGSSAFWGKKPLLGSFLRASKTESREPDRPCERGVVESPGSVPEVSFSGVTTQSHHGIVDSAAQDGVIGRLALERLEEDLRSRGLKPRWCDRVVRTKGIGGEARSVGVCELPLSIGGVAGVMEAAVVEGEVECLELRALNMTVAGRMIFVSSRSPLEEVGPLEDLRNRLFRAMNLLLQLRSGAPSSPARSGPSGGHNPRRALAAWRLVMDKLIDLILLADTQARVADWFNGSLLHAWLPSAAAPVAWEPSTPREPGKRTAARVGDYKRWISSGKAQVLAARKAKAAPAVACLGRWNANGTEEFIAEQRCREDAAMTGPAPSGTPHCLCGSPAVRLATKKPGPTEGRHFWVCQYFDWDQEEVAKLQGEKRKEMSDQKEQIQMLQAQLLSNQEEYERTIMAQRSQFETALGQLQMASGISGWRAMQLEERISHGRARVASEGYWWKPLHSEGACQTQWHFAAGLVPDFSEGVRVRGIFHEDFYGSDGNAWLEQKTLSKQKAKKIMRAFAGPRASGECSRDGARNLEPAWSWHEFRCSRVPCAVFVVQMLDPGEAFRWQSVDLGQKRAVVLYVGPEFRKYGCDWYRWQLEKQGSAALLVQEPRENIEAGAASFFAKGTHIDVERVWSSLSCNSSFTLFGSVIRWSFEDELYQAKGSAVFHEGEADDLDLEAEPLEPEEGTAEAPNLAAAEELTPHQKTLVKRMHDNMGHPDSLTFLRTLRRAKASPAVQKYVKEKFECEACKSRPLPKPSRPATVSRGYRPGVIVGVDVVFFPDVDPRQLKPVLNIIDLGSGYQALEPMREKTAAEAFRKFWKAWGRPFGSPEVLVTDAGTEFGREFCEMAAGRGIVTRQVGSRAPWQQAKLLFERVRDEVCPTTKEEWATALRETEAAKNRLYHRSGFTPAQRHLGQAPRIPGCLMSDDFLDAELVEGGANEEMRRVLEIRSAAAEAFMKLKAGKHALELRGQGRGATSRESYRAKSQLGNLAFVLGGDCDPDVFSLERHAPTASSLTLAMAMQVASMKRWLFARQPDNGLKGLDPGQLLEIVAGAYGLNDAPAHWRRSLKKALMQLGFEQSVMDPTLFLLKKQRQVAGMVIVEVDDLWTAGDEDHYKQIDALRRRFVFGKFKFLQEELEGVGFNGRRMKQDECFNFSYDLQKFIEERLAPVEITGKIADERATDQDLRGEGRAGLFELVGVRDLKEIDKTAERAKASASLCIKVNGIPEEEIGFGVVSDASYGNVRDGGSQGGHCVVSFNVGIHKGEAAECNILYWKSGRIHRVVNSTLAAESMSLSRTLGDLMWCVTLFNELTHAGFELKEWEQALKHRRLCVVPGKQEGCRNRAVVDAKSLYDHLSKETCGHTADRRTAIEMQIIRQTLSELGASIRWIEHNRMLVDSLTKVGGNAEPLIKVLESGRWRIVAEAQEVEKRKLLKAQGALVRHKKSGIKENSGSCKQPSCCE